MSVVHKTVLRLEKYSSPPVLKKGVCILC